MKDGRKPAEVEKVIEALKEQAKGLEYVFETAEKAEKLGYFNPFMNLTYAEVLELKDRMVVLLEEYEELLKDFEDGFILLDTGDRTVQANPSSLRSGVNAPAYKANLDGAKMYQLLKSGLSLNKIAKRFNCSPDTVKRRIYKIQQDEKKE